MEEVARAQVVGWKNIVDTTHAKLQQSAAPPVERGLTDQEKAAARGIFGNGLNLDAIRLTDDSFLGTLKPDNAVSTPGAINFPPGTLTNRTSDPSYLPWLMHELTHQWQYQHGFRLDQLAVAAATGNYDYGGDAGLEAASQQQKGIQSFNFEQQGDIVRDYYLRKTAGLDTKVFQPFIDEIQANRPDLNAPPDWPPP